MAYEQDFRQLSAQYLTRKASGTWHTGACRPLESAAFLATAHYVLASYERLRQRVPLTPVGSLSCARSRWSRWCRCCKLRPGIALEMHVGAFNTYAQDILDPASTLYRFAPDVVLLAIQTRDIVPELWSGYADLTAEARDTAISHTISAHLHHHLA